MSTAFEKKWFDKLDHHNQQFSRDVFKNESVLINPDSVAKDKNIAIHSAGWFWKKNNLNLHADKDDVIAVTKKINGSTIGSDERKKLTQEFKKSFGFEEGTTHNVT